MSDPIWRKGRLLVAAPHLVDPNFHRTVVLVLEHSEDGALGVVLNRPTSLPTHEALPERLAAPLPDDDVIFEGGPVEPGSVILLGDFVDGFPAQGEIAVGSIRVVEPDADFSELPERVRSLRAFGGYSGWGAGQLEEEMGEEAWIDCPCEVADVFCDRPDDLWRAVLERQGGHLRLVARMPEDPSLN